MVVRHLIDRVFSVFGTPETLQSDQGKEFQNQLMKKLQSVFGHKKTRAATAYRSQGNSVLERIHSTVHDMLATCTATWLAIIGRNCYRLSSSCSTRPIPKLWRVLPHYLVFGHTATFPVEIILGFTSTDAPQKINWTTHVAH